MANHSQFTLLKQRRFAPFFATQFLGALNDNVFRNGFLILATFQGVQLFGWDQTMLANAAGIAFILPFVLLSATAGQIADKYEKSLLIRRIKLFEIGLMIVAAGAFIGERYGVLLLVLFLMGAQSTLFGPVKYAYLPQQLKSSELIGGNALVEAGTFTAIIIGLIIGGIAVSIDPGNALPVGGCLVAFSAAGYLASRRIPPTPAADPGLEIGANAWRESMRIIGFAREKKSVFLSILGISWFWFFGTVMTIQFPAYTKTILGANEYIATTLLATFAVGVGIGSVLCERMSGHRVELGLVPFGALGLTVFGVDLYFAQPGPSGNQVESIAGFLATPGSLRVLFDLTMIGAFGGFYSVPLFALVQQRSNPKHLSRIFAANNIINSFFMVAASIMSVLLLSAGLSIPQLFLVTAILNAVVAVYIFSLLPEFMMRFLAWIIISVVYRVRPVGVENIPEKGPAIVVCNHVSYVDPIILSGSVRRPMRFVMWYRIFEIPLLNIVFRHARAIPIASAREDEAMMERAFEQVDAELEAGNIVCIFPEGGITRDGEVQRFRPGIERIIRERPVPVIPVALGGLWGSWFSRDGRGVLRKFPGRLFARVPVSIGKPVPPSAVTAPRLEMLVRTLRGNRR